MISMDFRFFITLAQGPQAALALGQALKNNIKYFNNGRQKIYKKMI